MALVGRRYRQGAVLVEGLCSLFLVTLGILLNVELIRRAQYDILLHQATFLKARFLGLGATRHSAQQQVREFLFKALGRRHGQHLISQSEWTVERTSHGLTAHVHYRYPTLLRFRMEEGWQKHHFEVTQRCLFPF